MDFGSFVLAATTADLADEPAARPHADAVEFRMDLASAPLESLSAYDGELPVIATNRSEREGGAAADGPGRLAALAEAAATPTVEAVDVELASVERGDADDAVERAREAGASVVVSTHDFEGTPPAPALRERLSRACAAGDAGKLAVTAETVDDALALLSATRALAARGESVATMAMGPAGRHTRAVAPAYGSRIGYAPVDPERATAPGQYDLATLSRLVDALGTKPEG